MQVKKKGYVKKWKNTGEMYKSLQEKNIFWIKK